MKKILFAALVCAATLSAVSCGNRSGETADGQRDSVITSDSAKAAAAVDSVNAFNDSVDAAQVTNK